MINCLSIPQLLSIVKSRCIFVECTETATSLIHPIFVVVSGLGTSTRPLIKSPSDQCRDFPNTRSCNFYCRSLRRSAICLQLLHIIYVLTCYDIYPPYSGSPFTILIALPKHTLQCRFTYILLYYTYCCKISGAIAMKYFTIVDTCIGSAVQR